MVYIVYVIAGLGAGIVTGLAGLSAAVVITPLLVSLCHWTGYDAVTVALASDVLASLLSAYTYYKNRNIDVKRGLLVTLTAFLGTVVGSWCGCLFSQAQPDGLGYLSMLTTVFLGIKFLIKPMTSGSGLKRSGSQTEDGPCHAAGMPDRLGLRLYGKRRRSPDADPIHIRSRLQPENRRGHKHNDYDDCRLDGRNQSYLHGSTDLSSAHVHCDPLLSGWRSCVGQIRQQV